MKTDITTTEKELPAVADLSIAFKSLAEKRFSSPAIKQIVKIEPRSLKTYVYMLITSTYIKCGQEAETDKVLASTTLFLEELEDYDYLTIKEIDKAFKDGYKGHYGKYYGLNVLTFITWIEYYVKNIRNESLAALRFKDPVAAALPELSDSSKELIIKNGCVRCFNEFKAAGYLPAGNSHIFDYLNDKEIISLDPDEIAELEIKAHTELRSEYDAKAARGANQRKAFAEIRSKLKEANNDRLTNRLNILKLTFFMQKLIDNNETIENYLK